MTEHYPIADDTYTSEASYDELADALALERARCHQLEQELKKAVRAAANAERASAEALRAHTKMVETLTETMRENTALSLERDMWKARARRIAAYAEDNQRNDDVPVPETLSHITVEEARAIRKAMARLHHPDSGGNPERMKYWNTTLDQIERQ